MRRTTDDKEAAAQDFVFDDRVFDGLPAPEEQFSPLLDEGEVSSESVSDADAGNRPVNTARKKKRFAAAFRLKGAPGSSRIISPSFWFLSAALFLIGLLFFAVHDASIGPRFFSRWFFPGTAKTAPEVTGHESQAAPLPATENDTRIAVPPAPKQTPARALTLATPATPPPRMAPSPTPSSEEATVSVPVVVNTIASEEEDAWFTLAEEYRQLGDLERAEGIYLRIIGEGSQPGRAFFALGELCLEKGEYRRARDLFLQSEQLYRAGGEQTTRQ